MSNDAQRTITQWYFGRLDAQFRRLDSISLGVYTLRQARLFYAALRGICDAHQYICAACADKHGQYPIDSAVIVKTRSRWAEEFARVTGLSATTVDAILDDLTMGERLIDLFVHPFVPLAPDSDLLGIIPHFPLGSRPDENLLRICSYVRPEFYDASSLLKEREMLDDLIDHTCRDFHFEPGVRLPNPVPDIDLVIEDLNSSTIVLAQLKWVRKPLYVSERIRHDGEILHGVNQAEKVRDFLESNPRYLRERRLIGRDLIEYDHVYHILVARDHFVWTDPAAIPVADHDEFRRLLGRDAGLRTIVEELLSYDWLPVEDRDFHVRYTPNRLNGVAVEHEVYFCGPPQPNQPK
jgi:hypothetical protein